MALSDKVSVITQGWIDLFKGKWEDLGLANVDDVYYGDQARYARTPAISVHSEIIRNLTQTGIQTNNDVTTTVMVFHSPYKSIDISQKETDQFAEKIEDLVHENRRLSGLLIHSHVATHTPGVAERGGTLLRANRLTIEGVTKTVVGG